MKRERGFTMVEIGIVLAIAAILTMMGLPSFMQWLQNSQIRTAAEALTNGLQTARNNAVQQNAQVLFTLTNANLSDYTVTLVNPPLNVPALIVQRTSQEGGSANAVVTVTPGGATEVTFNQFGRVMPNGDATPSITQLDIASVATSSVQARAMRVVVGNNVRMCDPIVAAGDPRAC